MDDAWKQSVESNKAAEVALCQQKDVSSQAQLLEGEVSFLKTQMSGCIKTDDDAVSSANK